FCIDHASDVAANGLVLPNNSRAAWVTADTGFHSAKIRSGVGRFSAGTKALEMNVSGMITMKEALLITSTLGTRRPTVAITHEKPEENNSRRAKPARASHHEVRILRPTSRPVRAMMVIERTLYRTSLAVRPKSTADRDIGSDRKRSMIPFCMS